ncbi:unnamed protein product [Protopolystoma xenopodis]|uniref:Uncharacterized protein n=1 Tax=Protopolystoma xenopodis TaxID=117903 RepID=A0A3S5CUG5_9PLAT|nr:unnamed protein product [Protopolystoma xenopodis]
MVLNRLKLGGGILPDQGEAKNGSFKIFPRDESPTSWRIQPSANSLYPPLLLIAPPGHLFLSRRWPSDSMSGGKSYKEVEKSPEDARGLHGYPPEADDMQTPLFVLGPMAKPGSRFHTKLFFS